MQSKKALKNATNNQIDRNLLAYAFVSQRLAVNNDYLETLIPLFIPVIEDMQGQVFDPAVFAEKVNNSYGLGINVDIVEELTPRLRKSGFLELISSDNQLGSTYLCKAGEGVGDYDDDYNKFLEKLNSLAVKFKNFVRKELVTLHTINMSDEELENILLEWLVYTDEDVSYAVYVCENGNDEKTSALQAKPKLKAEAEYLCARFVEFLEQDDIELFNDLSIIASGAMVAEVVLHLAEPEKKDHDYSDMNVYLDAPILMNLFALSGSAKKDCAEYMIDGLKKLGCRLRVFQHSLNELQEVVAQTLKTPRLYVVRVFWTQCIKI